VGYLERQDHQAARTFHALPSTDRRELSAARLALAVASRQLRDELELLEQAQRPTDRLGRIGAELAAATTELAELKHFDDVASGNPDITQACRRPGLEPASRATCPCTVRRRCVSAGSHTNVDAASDAAA
jgi:hypothetical protein